MNKQRLTREAWLAKALDLVARQGEAELRIDRLTRNLGVSKGSFYWHFRDRADFVRSLAEHWERTFTTALVKQVESVEDGRAELHQIVRAVVENNLGRYDDAMRGWAAHDPQVAAIVRRTYRLRQRTVRAAFAGLGFGKREADERAVTLVALMTYEYSAFSRDSRRRRIERVARILKLLTRR